MIQDQVPFGYWYKHEQRFVTVYESQNHFDSKGRESLLIPLYLHKDKAVVSEPVAIGKYHNGKYIAIGLDQLETDKDKAEWSPDGELLYRHPSRHLSHEYLLQLWDEVKHQMPKKQIIAFALAVMREANK